MLLLGKVRVGVFWCLKIFMFMLASPIPDYNLRHDLRRNIHSWIVSVWMLSPSGEGSTAPLMTEQCLFYHKATKHYNSRKMIDSMSFLLSRKSNLKKSSFIRARDLYPPHSCQWPQGDPVVDSRCLATVTGIMSSASYYCLFFCEQSFGRVSVTPSVVIKTKFYVYFNRIIIIEFLKLKKKKINCHGISGTRKFRTILV